MSKKKLWWVLGLGPVKDGFMGLFEMGVAGVHNVELCYTLCTL